jgi:regulator of CtrA degradation
MRLTTRLMQVASWLLLQRAVNEGELTWSQAHADRLRVKLSRQEYRLRARGLRTIAARPCGA